MTARCIRKRPFVIQMLPCLSYLSNKLMRRGWTSTPWQRQQLTASSPAWNPKQRERLNNYVQINLSVTLSNLTWYMGVGREIGVCILQRLPLNNNHKLSLYGNNNKKKCTSFYINFHHQLLHCIWWCNKEPVLPPPPRKKKKILPHTFSHSINYQPF